MCLQEGEGEGKAVRCDVVTALLLALPLTPVRSFLSSPEATAQIREGEKRARKEECAYFFCALVSFESPYAHEAYYSFPSTIHNASKRKKAKVKKLVRNSCSGRYLTMAIQRRQVGLFFFFFIGLSLLA